MRNLLFWVVLLMLFSACTKELTPEEIYENSKESIVMLVCYDINHMPLAQGSGFFTSEDTIITNYHVVKNAHSVEYKFIGDNASYNDTHIVSFNDEHDVAKIATKSKHKALICDKKPDDKVGSSVYAIGNPKGLEGTMSEGIISAIRTGEEADYIQITAPISPGSSGGPLINTRGNVIGISTASYTNGQNLNFAVPIQFADLCNVKFNVSNKAIVKVDSINEPVAVKTFKVECAPYRGECWLQLSVKNNTNRDIKNLQGILIFYDHDSGEMVDYSFFNEDISILSGFTKKMRIYFDRVSLQQGTGYPMFNADFSAIENTFGFVSERNENNLYISKTKYSSIEIRFLTYETE